MELELNHGVSVLKLSTPFSKHLNLLLVTVIIHICNYSPNQRKIRECCDLLSRVYKAYSQYISHYNNF